MIQRVLDALAAKPCGNGWTARCPAHDDTQPSLSIGIGTNGALLLHCFRGCGYSQIIRAIESKAAALSPNATNGCVGVSSQAGGLIPEMRTTDAARTAAALRIWNKTVPLAATPAEKYLRARSITITPPACLRFHFNLKHPSGRCLSAMVAAVSNVNDTIIAIHRTYLLPRLRTDKRMLGPVSGGAVRLASVAAKIGIAEGIETALSVMQLSELPTWAALSASGMVAIELPDEIREITICADGDVTGRKAARTLAVRLQHEGRVVRIAEAPAGLDFNDVLRGRS